MIRPGILLAACFLPLFAAPGFAAELLISEPQDEHIDPASSVSVSVRPGTKVSLVAALYDKLDGGGWRDRGHRADEFLWQANCDANSPACPTITTTPGSVVITINAPICLPLGTTSFTISMPSPPEGESAPSAAHVTLSNTEAPSICPGMKAGVGVTAAAVNATPAAEAQAQAQAASSRGSNGAGGHGSPSDPRRDPRWQKAWAEANGYGDAQYSNGSERGFNYGEQPNGSVVVSCFYKRNSLRCRHVELAKKRPPVRKAKNKQRSLKKRLR